MKVRIKFAKSGVMRFIGHLDMMRYFQKAFRRSGIDISYSKGFSPHQLISFASPLSVGLTSSGEYMDIDMGSCPPTKELVDILNAQMVEGVRILDAVLLPENSKNAMSMVTAADYKITLREEITSFENLQDAICVLMKADTLSVIKQTKKSLKEVNIRPSIHELTSCKEDGEISVFMRIDAGSSMNLKPELVMETIFKQLEIPFIPSAFTIHRMELYGPDGLPLSASGEIIHEK